MLNKHTAYFRPNVRSRVYPQGVRGDHHRCGRDSTPQSKGKWKENGGKLSLGAACRAEGPFTGIALQMCIQGSLNRPKDGDGTPLEERQKRAEDKDTNLLCLTAKARAGLKDAALPGVLGRRHGPADDRPAGAGGRAPGPPGGGREHSLHRPAGCTAASDAWAGSAPPDSPSPAHPESLLTCWSLSDEATTNLTELQRPIIAGSRPSASRRGTPLDAPPRGAVDWPGSSHVIVLLPELGDLLRACAVDASPTHPSLSTVGPWWDFLTRRAGVARVVWRKPVG